MRGATILGVGATALLLLCTVVVLKTTTTTTTVATTSVGDIRYDWYLQNPPNVTDRKPLPRFHHAVAAVTGNYSWNNGTWNNSTGNRSESYVVVIGGFDFIGDGVFLNDTWIFHTRNNTWRWVNHTSHYNNHTQTNITRRAYFSANTYRHEVVIFAGHGPDESMYNDVYRFYDYEWHKDTYHPNVSDYTKSILYREYHASAVVGDVLYVFGGHTLFYGRTTNELLAYNLTSRNWTIVLSFPAPGPAARQGHTLHYYKDAFFGDTLILFGGYSDQPYTGGYNDAWQYSIRDNKWYQLSGVGAPEGRSGHSGAIVGNTLYIQGGYSVNNIDKPPTYDTYYGDTWSLTLNGGGAAKWAQVTNDTEFGLGRRQGHQIVAVEQTLYSFGGYVQYVGLDNSVWAFQNV